MSVPILSILESRGCVLVDVDRWYFNHNHEINIGKFKDRYFRHGNEKRRQSYKFLQRLFKFVHVYFVNKKLRETEIFYLS